MDLENIWQEHKRFITTLGIGLFAFLIGTFVINRVYGGKIRAQNGRITKAKNQLKGELYQAADRTTAREVNDGLTARVDTLSGAVAFEPRPEFTLQSGETAQNVYLSALERVRDELADLASRKRAFLPDGLGVERLNTTRNSDAIERRLHALDLLERSVRLALNSGVKRVTDVEIELDRAFVSGRGLGAVERTTVEVGVTSDADSVTRWLARAETPDPNDTTGVRRAALAFDRAEVTRRSLDDDDVTATVRFVVVRLHGAGDSSGDSTGDEFDDQ